MIRTFLMVVVAVVILVIGGLLVVGIFPPSPQPHTVEKVVPNDKFTTH